MNNNNQTNLVRKNLHCCICVVSLMHASRDIRFEFNYSGSQFWFLQWLSLASPDLSTEIIICRFADEWGGVFHPHTPHPPVSPPLSTCNEAQAPHTPKQSNTNEQDSIMTPREKSFSTFKTQVACLESDVV